MSLQKTIRPKISTNLAISADGKISSFPPRPSGWTSQADHARLLQLRSTADAIMVGHGTLKSDRMTLTVPGKNRQPLRCIVSRTGQLDPQHPIFSRPGGEIHLLTTDHFLGEGLSQVTLHQGSLLQFFHTLASEHQVKALHCEGGGQLIRALAELEVIDEFHLTLAGHTLFGGENAATATGILGKFLPRSSHFQLTHFQPVPEIGECFLTYSRVD
jgi:2,5-diamino-6-(ribosylamino)-4(3H)-pyrimidinone 5'-phosphate reductase